ncbi:hypothetical protein [Nocardioides sp.]|uniref:hypothetical protein n=1 Tax=Nocardioides sp. TaxID=35761 RepID=UPI00286DB350|nr:hypothetical protein [Nocardioides sp.]
MNTTYTMTAGKTRSESVACSRVRQERLRQLSARSIIVGCTPAQYVPRHRADVRVDSVA